MDARIDEVAIFVGDLVKEGHTGHPDGHVQPCHQDATR